MDKHCRNKRQRRIPKYLGKSCCHRIECTLANSLAALMRKWPLHSIIVVLQPPQETYRGGWWDKYQYKPSTTPRVGWRWRKICGINKGRDPRDQKGRKEKSKHCSNLNNSCNHYHPIYTRTELLRVCRGQTFLYKLGSFLFDCLGNSL